MELARHEMPGLPGLLTKSRDSLPDDGFFASRD
jgi:hypothetical protein